MRSTFVLAFLTILVGGEAVRADKQDGPISYERVSANKKFVLVVHAPGAKGKSDLRDAYPKAGLYKNDGSKDPLWTIDWHRDQVYVANDGIHLVREGYWAGRNIHLR